MYPSHYIDFLVHFHGDRDYFECHEILEEYWKEIDAGNKNSVWVGFILLSVSCYHHRRGNYEGASRTIEKSLKILSKNHQDLYNLGIDADQLIILLGSRLLEINNRKQYSSLNLPIINKALIQKCLEKCRLLQMEWCKESNLSNIDLIHRHSRRDRTQVIMDRLDSLNKRKK